MKKLILIVLIAIFFLMGVKLGGNYTTSSSNLFESSKERFEKEITTPNSSYEPIELVPTPGITNKVAQKIDEILEKIMDKVVAGIG